MLSSPKCEKSASTPVIYNIIYGGEQVHVE
jgi:hypothetical protein